MHQFDPGSVNLIIPNFDNTSAIAPIFFFFFLFFQHFWKHLVKPQMHTAVYEKTDRGLVKANLQKQNPSISLQHFSFGRLCNHHDVPAARNNISHGQSSMTFLHSHTRLSHLPRNCGKIWTVQHFYSTAIDYLLARLDALLFKKSNFAFFFTVVVVYFD